MSIITNFIHFYKRFLVEKFKHLKHLIISFSFKLLDKIRRIVYDIIYLLYDCFWLIYINP